MPPTPAPATDALTLIDADVEAAADAELSALVAAAQSAASAGAGAVAVTHTTVSAVAGPVADRVCIRRVFDCPLAGGRKPCFKPDCGCCCGSKPDDDEPVYASVYGSKPCVNCGLKDC